ncbi:MAG TPA: transcriptional regulator [Opitutae bacterium]|nr:transcriptional regulator [Puniceicoccaceae bacterium]HBR93883.1 transcriptional regulator [Opitutae bacterium]|tara:strand:+ start:353 stop:595 length:243 start_codon:yes stop_codon:yes gene_type:complete
MTGKKDPTTKQIAVRVGSSVRSAREDANLSQDELAWRAGIHRAYMGVIERGEQNITIYKLYQVAEAMNLQPSEILEAADL